MLKNLVAATVAISLLPPLLALGCNKTDDAPPPLPAASVATTAPTLAPTTPTPPQQQAAATAAPQAGAAGPAPGPAAARPVKLADGGMTQVGVARPEAGVAPVALPTGFPSTLPSGLPKTLPQVSALPQITAIPHPSAVGAALSAVLPGLLPVAPAASR